MRLIADSSRNLTMKLVSLHPYTTLGPQGCTIEGSRLHISLRGDIVAKLIKDLTVQPIGHPDYKKPDPWSLFELNFNSHLWRVPRAWAQEHIGELTFQVPEGWWDATISSGPQPLQTLFNSIPSPALRSHQEAAFAQVTKYLTEESAVGIVQLPTAWGKTMFGIFLSRFFYGRFTSSWPFRVLIVVHTTDIGAEWIKTIEKFCFKEADDDRLIVGQISGKKKDHLKHSNTPFTIATVQTLVGMDTISNELGAPFEFVIFDEAHHYGAETFSKVNYIVNGKYMLGLSATPDRKDGLEKALHAHLRDVFYAENVTIFPERWSLRVHNISFTPSVVKKVWVPAVKAMKETYATKLTALSTCRERSRYIAKVIVDVLGADPQRRLVAFGERLELVYQVAEAIAEFNQEEKYIIRTYTGKEKQRGSKLQTLLSEDFHVLLTSYKIFGEGVSSDRLNGVVVMSGLAGAGRMRQPIGRILRKAHDNIDVLIVDFNDSLLPGLIYNRITQYKDRLGDKNLERQTYWSPDDQTLLPKTVADKQHVKQIPPSQLPPQKRHRLHIQ